MGKVEVETFLTHLAVNRRVAPSTQNVALAAILFLYQKVLEIDLPCLEDVIRAKPRRRVPVVLNQVIVSTTFPLALRPVTAANAAANWSSG